MSIESIVDPSTGSVIQTEPDSGTYIKIIHRNGTEARINSPDGEYDRAGVYWGVEIPVPPVVEPVPVVLPNLEFLRYAAAQLGSGGRVTEIIEGFRDHATADLRYGFQEFDKATSFDKVKVDELLGAGVTGGILTAEEHQLINENWPES